MLESERTEAQGTVGRQVSGTSQLSCQGQRVGKDRQELRGLAGGGAATLVELKGKAGLGAGTK